MNRGRYTLELLDCFRLVGEASPTDIPPTARRLLAFLAVHSGHVSRAAAAQALWYREQGAAANLRSAIWCLRRRVPSAIGANRVDLWLTSHVIVDLHEQLAFARGRVTNPDAPPSPRELTLLSGELLPDWPDEWLRRERSRSRELRLHALQALSQHYFNAGAYGLAIEAAAALLGIDPTRERGYELLVQAHAGEGNLSEAHKHFERYLAVSRRTSHPRLERLLQRARPSPNRNTPTVL